MPNRCFAMFLIERLPISWTSQESDNEAQAKVLLTNTCAIREGKFKKINIVCIPITSSLFIYPRFVNYEGAEGKVWHRMRELRGRFKGKKGRKLVGVLGCMAERLRENLFADGLADLVVGPDAYRCVADDRERRSIDFGIVCLNCPNAVETYRACSKILQRKIHQWRKLLMCSLAWMKHMPKSNQCEGILTTFLALSGMCGNF